MTRIERRFAELKERGRAGLVTFITAGDPDYATSLKLLESLPKAGADIVELGMPFSDPMADGPAIQASSARALHAGQTMVKTLAMVKSFRDKDEITPIVLMGYYNPIYIYGVDRFLKDAVAAGVDGLIVVDMPPEEDAELRPPASEAGLNFIRLATPTTDAKRMPAVLANSSGFVYYVSIAGITGTAAPDLADVGAHVARIKAATKLPDRRRLRREDQGAGRRDRQGGRGRRRWLCARRRHRPKPRRRGQGDAGYRPKGLGSCRRARFGAPRAGHGRRALGTISSLGECCF